MSIPPTADSVSLVLFGILLACIFGLIGFVWVKLGARPKDLDYRGLKIRKHADLPNGKIVLTDAAWRPIGETDPGQFDTIALPPGCAAALLSKSDFSRFATRCHPAVAVPA